MDQWDSHFNKEDSNQWWEPQCFNNHLLDNNQTNNKDTILKDKNKYNNKDNKDNKDTKKNHNNIKQKVNTKINNKDK